MLSGLELSKPEFRDLTPTITPIKAEANRIIKAKAVKNSFFLLLDRLICMPESKPSEKKSVVRDMIMKWIGDDLLKKEETIVVEVDGESRVLHVCFYKTIAYIR